MKNGKTILFNNDGQCIHLFRVFSSSSGIRLVYLPPYSPDLNPIKECFSFVKAYIWRSGNAFRDIVEGGDPIDPFLYLYNVLDLRVRLIYMVVTHIILSQMD